MSRAHLAFSLRFTQEKWQCVLHRTGSSEIRASLADIVKSSSRGVHINAMKRELIHNPVFALCPYRKRGIDGAHGAPFQ